MLSSTTETEVVMPQMGVSVAEGTIIAWLKQPGEEVAADEPICEVSTDKVDVEVPAPASGTLESIAVAEGETVAVGTLLATISSVVGGAGAAVPRDGSATGEAGAANGAASATGAEAVTRDGAGELDRSSFYSPVVRRIAEQHHVDLAQVHGEGVGGRVRKRDLLEHISRAGNGHDRPLHSESPYQPEGAAEAAAQDLPAPQPGGAGPASIDDLIGPSERLPMEPMRAAIAKHMIESRKTSAHCTTVVEADFSAVVRERDELRGPMQERGVSLTYLAFVARAAIEGLAEHPILNASVEGSEIVMHADVNLGIAVALDDGLIVPVIRKAQRLSLEGLAAAIGDVASKAREGRLEPDDLVGGTFTITNPGQFGAVLATPIINQPQVAILDLEAVLRRPVVVGAGAQESIGIRPMSYLCMSWDHRALDGSDAARFLAGVKRSLESGAGL